MVRVTACLIFFGAWISFGGQEAYAFKCCMSCQVSADSETECAEHHCSVHGAQDSCDFLGVGDSSEDTGSDSSGTESSDASSTVELSPAAQAAIEKLGYELGQKLARDLFGPTPAEKAAEAEHRRELMAEGGRYVEEMEATDKMNLEEGTGELLQEMKSLDTFQRLDFASYTERMNETRDALEDLRQKAAEGEVEPSVLDWCKLHIPLYPTQPIQPIPEEQYQTMLEDYWKRKAVWDEKCAAGGKEEEAGASTTSLTSLPLKNLSGSGGLSPPPPSGILSVGPKGWDSCTNDYNRHTRGCEGGDGLPQKLACINNAIQEWQQCIGKAGP